MRPAKLLPLALLSVATSAARYEEYILAPSSRTVYPASIHRVNGTVTNAQALIPTADSSSSSSTNATTLIHGNSSVTLDYGKAIGGRVSLHIGSVSTTTSDAVILGVTFTESDFWINGAACDATADAGLDSPLWFTLDGPGTYTAASEFLRGSFRYLSIVSNSSAAVEIQSVTVNFTAAPEQDLQAYTGYFHSDDEVLNRVWYAGAYTCQLCSIDPTTGDSLILLNTVNSSQTIELPETVQWHSNYTITAGKTALVDGAKRDRLVWPGDIVVAAPTILVSTNDMDSLRNSLDSLLALQNSSGALPYAGNPFWESVGEPYSFTYHMHSLLDIGIYYEFTEDLGYLQSVWKNFTLGLEYTISFVDETGLLNVTTTPDWLRLGMGGHNIEANAILYHTLNQGINLASILNDSSSPALWPTYAANIKTAAKALLWDATTSLYLDNETTTLHPQDGNAWAVYANLTLTPTQSTAITTALQSRWGPYGAPAPETDATPQTISPFASYFELLAHHAAGNPTAANELLRRQWGYMLDGPHMTNSTFTEGFASDGSLEYGPYTNSARVSQAHGWSTGPTSVLTFYTAGLRLASAGGRTWVVAPRLGGLGSVEAGFEAPRGRFAVDVRADEESGVVMFLEFSTPLGTTGEVSLPGVVGSLRSEAGDVVELVGGEASGVAGGSWTLITA